jgi:uncharacterized protein (UPF0335 family)
MANDQYRFPDELEDSKAKGGKVEDEIEIDIEDDTPEDDRNKAPLPKEIADELYNDELEDYSSKVKKKLVQLKKLAHDERREKEAVQREQAEAVNLAKHLIEENNRLKSNLNNSEKHVLESVKRSVDMEMADAERDYRDAYESGDSEKLLAAQKKLNSASIKVDKVANFKQPALQEEKYEVQTTQRTAPLIPVDTKAQSWQKENSWFGEDKLMTGMALALHEVLKEEGVALSSAEYYRRINETMRQRFPEKFQDQSEDDTQRTGNRSTKPSTVVAPATRTTSSKRVSLTRSQLGIAKKLNLTPEQYAQAVLKLEA